MMSVLIADDNASMRRLICRLLAKVTNEVYECADGAAAVAAYLEHRPDWVVMDLEMPQVDGLEATRRICAFGGVARVIVVTNHDDSWLRRAAVDAGALAFLVKDDLSRLCALITETTAAH